MFGVKHRTARERRKEATGKFFEKQKSVPHIWTNHIYPVLLIISLLFYIFTL